MRTHAIPVAALALAAAMSTSAIPASALGAPPLERPNSDAERRSLSMTVYTDYGLVRDVRWVNLTPGITREAFEDVSPQIDQSTTFFTDVESNVPIWLDSQYFDVGGYGYDDVLKGNVGKKVLIITTDPKTGAESTHVVTLLSTDGPTLLYPGRIEIGVPPNSRIAFFSLPPNLRDRPALVADLGSYASAHSAICINYVTNGLAWTTDYIALLNPEQTRLDIDAIASVQNTTGVDFDGAQVELVGGSPQRFQVSQTAYNRPMVLGHVTADVVSEMGNANNNATRQGLLEYYLYTVPRPLSLRNGKTTTFSLFSGKSVPADIAYDVAGQMGQGLTSTVDGTVADTVETFVEFTNAGMGLGIPLPPGVFHLFKLDSSNAHQFIGEDAIDAAPKNALVRLDVGTSSDIGVKEVQTDFRAVPVYAPNKILVLRTDYYSAYRVTLTNAKNKPATVHLTEEMSGEWRIADETLPHVKLSTDLIAWNVPVPANGSTTLDYTVFTEE